MFCCFPDSSKCEWRKLEPFVRQYNKKFNVKYFLSKCLDVFDNTKPQPEIRLKSEKEKDIVIEHKIITWPPNYLQLHRAEHEFMNFFTESVSPQFQDNVYLLGINSKNIAINKGINKGVAKKIANIVINNKERILAVGSFYSSQPFKWSFRCLRESEKDENTPKKGVGVQVYSDDQSFFSMNNEVDDTDEAINGVKKILISHLRKAETKFHDYSDCIRIFITELHGEHLSVDHEAIEEILPNIEIPRNIDQIWVGYPEWISANSHETAYKLLKNE